MDVIPANLLQNKQLYRIFSWNMPAYSHLLHENVLFRSNVDAKLNMLCGWIIIINVSKYSA